MCQPSPFITNIRISLIHILFTLILRLSVLKRGTSSAYLVTFPPSSLAVNYCGLLKPGYPIYLVFLLRWFIKIESRHSRLMNDSGSGGGGGDVSS